MREARAKIEAGAGAGDCCREGGSGERREQTSGSRLYQLRATHVRSHASHLTEHRSRSLDRPALREPGGRDVQTRRPRVHARRAALCEPNAPRGALPEALRRDESAGGSGC